MHKSSLYTTLPLLPCQDEHRVSTLLAASVTVIFPPLISTLFLRYFRFAYVDNSILQLPLCFYSAVIELTFDLASAASFTDECLRPFKSFIPVMIHYLGCMILAPEFCENFNFSTFLTSSKPSVSSKILPWDASVLTNQHPSIMDSLVNWLKKVISGTPHCWIILFLCISTLADITYIYICNIYTYMGFPGNSDSRERTCQCRKVQSVGREDPLEKGMATHSSVLAWRIPWTEEPGGLQSMGSQRIRHNPARMHTLRTLTSFYT